jgi:UDP-N-acetylmuramoylalanine--D-glutamate ligase
VTTRGRVTVQGLGRFGGGVGAARFLAREGWQVTVTDLQSELELQDSIAALGGAEIRLVLGGHERTDFTDTELVIANPAVSPKNEFLLAARGAGVPVATEIGLFLERCPAKIAGITGTQGKSSTAHFLYQLLDAAGLPARLGGNIGRSLLDELDSMTEDETCVLELSSYQLEGLSRELCAKPLSLGILTNLQEDHLERHGDAKNYHLAKLELVSLLADQAPLLAGAGVSMRAQELAPSALERVSLEECADTVATEDSFTIMGELLGSTADAAHLPRFQRANLLLALRAARLLGAESSALRAALPGLTGLEHRLEDLGLIAGRQIYDNGVSTTPDSTQAALASLSGPLTLIAGGQAKALPLKELVLAIAARPVQVVLFGACAAEWARALRAADVKCEITADVPEAAERALALCEEGEAILFSPAAASFDAYPNFRERAIEFRAAITGRREIDIKTS